ncbi:TolC family outer membrane protein [Paracoccus aerodenitrificans]|uniref:TolC family outer membrane protein n=1 Tax=Paracoccus aerodenitrificans TaxID=3017781 RepID=UPI0022F0FC66|nr:TolC family outer membrane protein [Paracoccus aerodenitrificans]WBU65086.1 TolC family outer membrane protein [Paracoccus aerodenitrificans]
MKKIGKAFLQRSMVAVLLAGTALPAAAQSLGDTLVAAYRHSALLEQNRAVLRAADEDVATAMAQLRPILQWALDHTFTDLDGVESTATSFGLTASMTLYDFGRSQAAIDMAKETVLATRYALVTVEQSILLSAVQAFMQVRAATEQVELEQNSVRVLEQDLQAAQDRFDVGEITVTDVAQANAAVAASRASLASAQGDLEIAREAYFAATGNRPGTLSVPSLPQRPASLAEARATAQRNHPAILQANREVAAAELAVVAAERERNPTFTGSAGVSADKEGDSQGRIGLQLSQTIYSGGRLSAAHRKAMANRDASRASLLNSAREVDEAVGTAWANIDVAAAQIGAINEQISAAQQAYDGVREEALLGARTTLDVLDSEQALLEARADMITAEANLQLAHYQLLSAMGLLTVEDLQLGIPTYDPSAYYNAVRDAPYTSRQGESLDRVLRAINRE